MATAPLDVSRLTVNTSGAVSGLASALGTSTGFFGSSEHPLNAASASGSQYQHVRIVTQYAMLEITLAALPDRRFQVNMAVYDSFAPFYQRYWNQEFHGLAFPILERIWLPRVPAGARILDLCCGTGYLAGLLVKRKYRVTGFDESAAMIDLARAH